MQRIGIDDGEEASGDFGQRADVDAAMGTDEEVRNPMAEAIAPEPTRLRHVECDAAPRIGSGAGAVRATEAALARPHGPLLRRPLGVV
jgi:hypothetical protein